MKNNYFFILNRKFICLVIECEKNKMNIKEIAQKALEISQTGQLPNGKDFSSQQTFAKINSKLFTPDALQKILQNCQQDQPNKTACQIEVWACSTQQAVFNLTSQGKDVALLNFASAKNAGGGFLGGAKAQEEDLCRASGLYECQLMCPAYYQANRANSSLIYTDHMIYSPKVPFFRLDDWLDDVFLASVITAPAPNMGAYLAKHKHGQVDVERAFVKRAELLLALLKSLGYRTLVLGAWGCGVFKNNPVFVASVFADLLNQPYFKTAFDEVIFAIYDKSQSQTTLNAFKNTFGK